MNKTNLIEKLTKKISRHDILIDEPMKNHTSFKIGGPVDILVMPDSIESTQYAYRVLRSENIPVTFLGNGSNVLVSDDGMAGAVIKLSAPFSAICVQEDRVIVEAGALLSKISHIAVKKGLTGFEFASGIPGTIGGAVFMNAGAYGGEMAQVVSSVTVLTPAGKILKLDNKALSFGYRQSSIQTKEYIILQVVLQLKNGERQIIKQTIDRLADKRTDKQPLDLPSAGSTFKRPEGHYAGKLIEESGLRGLRYGDAMVSQKHCGFIVNVGEATCEHVTTLIGTIQKIVDDTFDVSLETEVRIIGKGYSSEAKC